MSSSQQLRQLSDLSDHQRALYDQLMRAMNDRDQQAMIELVKKGAPLDVQENSTRGETPLHRACVNSLKEAALVMIDKGAPLDAKNESGRTPLFWACQPQLVDVALAMVEKGAPLNTQDRKGDTPLLWAITGSLEDVALAILEKGASMDIQNKAGDTPLHKASQYGFEQLALNMIGRRAPLEVQDNLGSTPLHNACTFDLESAALEMIKKGAPLDKKNSNSQTPLHLAFEWGLEQAALKMIEAGASLKVRDFNELTPVDKLDNAYDMYAAFRRHVLLPAMLMEAGKDASQISIADDELHFSGEAIAQRLHPIPDYLHEAGTSISDSMAAKLMRRIRLSRSWHHPPITFPRELLPHLPNRRWQPLIAEEYTAPNGLHVSNLTSSYDLANESRALDHCIGESNYDMRCCQSDPEQRSHIFSIRTEDGLPVSTLHVKVIETDGKPGI